EEFALLIPDVNTTALREIMEKIRTSIEHDVRCGDTPVTASFGASLLREGESETEWGKRVDAAMYRAKREGRNRSVIDGLSSSAGSDGRVLASVGNSPDLPSDRVPPVDHTKP